MYLYMYIHVCIYICTYVYVCMCVCMGGWVFLLAVKIEVIGKGDSRGEEVKERKKESK